MEKLIELLNKYEEKKEKYVWSEYDLCYRPDRIILAISKHYGFIERLVKNDKIRRNYGYVYREDYNDIYKYHAYSEYESILFFLANSDNPIELLCRYIGE